MDNTVMVKVNRENDDIKMIFCFEQELELVLTSDKIESLQQFFIEILHKMIEKGEAFDFKLEDDIDDLYHDVSSKYISNLNVEMKNIFKEIPQRDYEFEALSK